MDDVVDAFAILFRWMFFKRGVRGDGVVDAVCVGDRFR